MTHPLPTPDQAIAYVAGCYAKWDGLASVPTIEDGGIRYHGAQDDERTRTVIASVSYANGETHREEWDCWMQPDPNAGGSLYVYGEF